MCRVVRAAPILLLLLLPPVFAIITIEPETVYENDVQEITVKVLPNLNVTETDNRPTELQLDDRWFNLTHTGGRVMGNITVWTPDAGANRTTFLISNLTLTDLKIWMNGSSPVTVYLDAVNSSAAWSYAAGVTKINATTAQNITLSWQPVEPGQGEEPEPSAAVEPEDEDDIISLSRQAPPPPMLHRPMILWMVVSVSVAAVALLVVFGLGRLHRSP